MLANGTWLYRGYLHTVSTQLSCWIPTNKNDRNWLYGDLRCSVFCLWLLPIVKTVKFFKLREIYSPRFVLWSEHFCVFLQSWSGWFGSAVMSTVPVIHRAALSFPFIAVLCRSLPSDSRKLLRTIVAVSGRDRRCRNGGAMGISMVAIRPGQAHPAPLHHYALVPNSVTPSL